MAEAIYSAIIKFFYHKNRVAEKNYIDNYNSGKHFIVPFYKINLTDEDFEKFLYPHLQLIKFIRDNPNIPLISYEDIYFSKKSLSVSLGSEKIHIDRLLFGNSITYNFDKKEYFINRENHQNIFWRKIEELSLKDICNQYNIDFY
jgi:hypothetical protein